MSNINPYAPSSISGQMDPNERTQKREFSWWMSLVIWTVVCVVAAAPSFMIAMSVVPRYTLPAIGVGIVLFIAGYVFVDYSTFHWEIRRRPAMRWSIYITYWMRAIISIIFPIGTFLDMFCGIVSSSVLSLFSYQPSTQQLPLWIVFLWTIVHAIVLHGVLLLFWGITYMVCAAAIGNAPDDEADIPAGSQ